jgi:membrane-bound lytic murein transglycosylase D
MAGEATRMGLKINSRVDERTNFNKSTHAAARILKELYSQFNDWTLVIAAYNCGAGRVRQAISKSGSKNFWTLQAYLPAETRNHVKRFISTHYIFEGSGGLTTMTALELDDYKARTDDLQTMQLLLDQNEGLKESTIKIAGKYNSAIIAKNIGIDISLFNKLNPNFNKCVSAGKTYLMKLPRGLDTVFSSKKNTILGESVQQLLNNSMAISK